ncbi:chloride channel protein [Croceicoccus sp. YJ47]|uniref:chloride channel protein n=1 Tax=Croceicoccus sp. YJ47 TaxID=2798724 RepID=UPI001920BA89|nr:chloride channel protein [Croceicoccus sp. YJ47]QQN73436.1 chloride channel protein [Croceicoccus sp. YJ47]
MLPRLIPPALARRVSAVETGDWRRRIATLAGAVAIGLVALGFAWAGDLALHRFETLAARWPWAPMVLTPAIFALCAWLTWRFAPETGGSGIPQVLAAIRRDDARADQLFSIKTALAKIGLTVLALFGGASVGREGPTVQLGAAIMTGTHRLTGAAMRRGVLISGGAAGVSAAFNTPLAGIAFAIEELAVAYEQRMAALVMGAVIIAGITAQGLAGNYVYFGALDASLPLHTVLIAAPLAGLIGGALGGGFSRLLLSLRARVRAGALGRRPVLLALGCGIVVAALGIATGGATWGTGYEPARLLLMGTEASPWLGPAKFAATLFTSLSGIPGGIFAPSLAVGAGFGQWLSLLFPDSAIGAIVMLGMVSYFTGVVRAPLTAVIILTETTGNIGLILPLFAAALFADWAGSLVCRKRLYHALAEDFMPPAETDGAAKPAG